MSDTSADNLASFAGPAPSEKAGIKSELLDMTLVEQQAEDEESAKADALEIWEKGDALGYMVAAAGEQHTGDVSLLTTLFLSYASTRITNSSGIHVSVSGPAGTGKSHSATTVAEYLPASAVSNTRISNKALWYAEFPAKTVFIIDDQELSEDMQELIKTVSTSWNKKAQYISVKNQQKQTLTINERSPFWVFKVNLNGDEQILDRQIMFWTEDTDEQRQAIRDVVYESVMTSDVVSSWNYKSLVCRELWKLIPDDVKVVIPFAKKIECDKRMDIRIIKLLLALLQSAALMRASKRKRDEVTGDIIAERADFVAASNIMNPLLCNKGGSQKLKLSMDGAKVLEYLKTQPSGEIPYSNIRSSLQLSDKQLSVALHGRNDVDMDGLMSVCPAVESTYQIVPEKGGASHRQKCLKWDFTTYERWCSAGGHFTLREDDE